MLASTPQSGESSFPPAVILRIAHVAEVLVPVITRSVIEKHVWDRLMRIESDQVSKDTTLMSEGEVSSLGFLGTVTC